MFTSKVTKITDYLIHYYLEAGRSYPWRQERTPYRVYLSEILLQRTRADQVKPVFEYLVSRYPGVCLLNERFQEASQALLTLGRTCRLQYFKSGLEYMVKNYGGKIPSDRKELLAVPGIGDYIAAAIRIFGFGIRDVIVDTNVVRVLCRLYGLQATPETRRRKCFIELASRHVPMSHCIEYSYGLLDFAAQVCRPVRPGCDICELSFLCEYGKNKID